MASVTCPGGLGDLLVVVGDSLLCDRVFNNGPCSDRLGVSSTSGRKALGWTERNESRGLKNDFCCAAGSKSRVGQGYVKWPTKLFQEKNPDQLAWESLMREIEASNDKDIGEILQRQHADGSLKRSDLLGAILRFNKMRNWMKVIQVQTLTGQILSSLFFQWFSSPWKPHAVSGIPTRSNELICTPHLSICIETLECVAQVVCCDFTVIFTWVSPCAAAMRAFRRGYLLSCMPERVSSSSRKVALLFMSLLQRNLNPKNDEPDIGPDIL